MGSVAEDAVLDYIHLDRDEVNMRVHRVLRKIGTNKSVRILESRIDQANLDRQKNRIRETIKQIEARI